VTYDGDKMKSLYLALACLTALPAFALTPVEFADRITRLKQLAESQIVEAGLAETTCYRLAQVNQAISSVEKSEFTHEFLNSRGATIINDLFSTRLAIRNRIGDAIGFGAISPNCLQSIRGFFRTARYIEEYIAEQMAHEQLAASRVFEGTSPTMMLNPAFSSHELRSGDILLSRGNAVVSAAIARIGDDDGQFSHIALIYIDEKSPERKIYSIEAHIEIGVVVAPIEKYLTDGKVRSVIYRPKDARFASIAAKLMYDRVSAESQGGGSNIPYDFGMDMTDTRELFCSEVASLGYSLASSKQFEIPLFKSTMTMKNKTFLNAIGVSVTETFAPTDIDVDPRFELVAEWRDLTKTQDARFLDAILTNMYDWMDSYDYILDSSLGQKLLHSGAWAARKTILFSKLLEEKFPTNMSSSALNTMVSLGEVGDRLLRLVKEANRQEEKNKGLGLTHFQVRELLDKARTEDFMKYQNSKKWFESNPEPLFHNYFHPREKSAWSIF
jgi:hypothetical protein